MLFSSQAHVVSQYPWSGINHLFTTRFNHFVLCFYGRQSTCFRFLLFLAFSIANEISWFTPHRDRTSEFFKLLITTRHYLWQKWKCNNYRRTGPSWLESNIYQRRLLCSSITLLNYANDKYWTIVYQKSYQILNKQLQNIYQQSLQCSSITLFNLAKDKYWTSDSLNRLNIIILAIHCQRCNCAILSTSTI